MKIVPRSNLLRAYEPKGQCCKNLESDVLLSTYYGSMDQEVPDTLILNVLDPTYYESMNQIIRVFIIQDETVLLSTYYGFYVDIHDRLTYNLIYTFTHKATI